MAAGIHVVAETCILVLTHALSGSPFYVNTDNIGGMFSNKLGNAVLIFDGGGIVAVNEKIADIIDTIRDDLPKPCLKVDGPHIHPHDMEPGK